MTENQYNLDSPLTFTYKEVDGISVLLDVYLPPHDVNQQCTQQVKHRPAVVYFHGGGFAVGNRRSWFPTWLKSRLSARGIIFISADYRLIPPGTGYDVLADTKDAIAFVAGDLNVQLNQQQAGLSSGSHFRIDPASIGVAGTSAGGFCAYLCAIHAVPKPKVVLSLYGMGGDLLTDHYIAPKTQPFLRGREMLDPARFSEYIHPFGSLPSTSDSPLAYHPLSYHIPGYPANPRMLISRLYLQLGVALDYITGQHEPSLSTTLRQAIHTEGPFDEALIADHKNIFPQFNVTSDWPATYLIHGTSDTAVLLRESRNLHSLLTKAGVEVVLEELPGREHSFDYQPGAELENKGSYDTIVQFLYGHLT
ncbi:Alpha/Beta hydrolase protein [Suillus clintonianus]|uniref:Alpha/Beta hydrolase protein n=1 Tax=Suillus clintonianus TaxID=1904413 RepID=UPI001B88547C|nr:Alpha/Beta hydrolase protein [Suillus clintonianus]KAG2123802.1 Alpha/Beta hydrolase protein [Suillus clintonianus]